MTRYILDDTKLAWHQDRLQAWARGERIVPITVDWAITTACNYHCQFCAAIGQTGVKRASLPWKVIDRTLHDMARMGVRGVVFMSDGENTLHKGFVDAVLLAKSLGLSVALATNGFMVSPTMAEKILPCLDYLRVNISAGQPSRYAEIMGVPEIYFYQICNNLRQMVYIKKSRNLPVTLNIQMVLRPQDADQIIPFAKLGKELGVDYAIIKHCLDYPEQGINVDYSKYEAIAPLIKQAEALTTEDYLVTAKWSKMQSRQREYKRCLGSPFLLQISGTGLVAACGPYFGPQYKQFHIGNINEQPLLEIWQSERYWEVMDYLASAQFDAQKCSPGCVQDSLNKALNKHLKGELDLDVSGPLPLHLNFV